MASNSSGVIKRPADSGPMAISCSADRGLITYLPGKKAAELLRPLYPASDKKSAPRRLSASALKNRWNRAGRPGYHAPMSSMPSVREMERAVNAGDASYDGVFFVGVRTTGIFCRPSCPARKPLPTNREYFAPAREALFA